jgi:hypothetical protein
MDSPFRVTVHRFGVQRSGLRTKKAINCPAASRGVSELKQLVLLVMKLAIFRAHFFGEHHYPIFGRY